MDQDECVMQQPGFTVLAVKPRTAMMCFFVMEVTIPDASSHQEMVAKEGKHSMCTLILRKAMVNL